MDTRSDPTKDTSVTPKVPRPENANRPTEDGADNRYTHSLAVLSKNGPQRNEWVAEL